MLPAPKSAPPNPWTAGRSLDDETFTAIRRRMMLYCCKWDAQIGDTCTLAPFPLILAKEVWAELASAAEHLTAEALAAELEILQKTELLAELGLPRAIRKILETSAPLTRSAARVMRFDFHLTTDGWRISEVNSDVPGGFTEASSFTKLIAEHYPSAAVTGDPIRHWSTAIASSAGSTGAVALLSAPGFMEDHQIIAYLARHLHEIGQQVHLAKPEQIVWREGCAHLESAWHKGPLQAIVRFYQGEWLSKLSRRIGWEHFFCRGRTPVGNPGCAIVTETKRFPLVWNQLGSALPTWKELLPETCDPRDVNWEQDESWLVKSALCNTGDTVSLRSHLDTPKWRNVVREVWTDPDQWLAQKRFTPVGIETPLGDMHACVGVYTVDGVVAGAYGRITDGPFIDYRAIDIAVLVANE